MQQDELRSLRWQYIMEVECLDRRSKLIEEFNRDSMSREAQISAAYEQKAEQEADARREAARCS